MKYVALLRGINVGKERRIDMKKLKILFESLGYSNVSTYINSGNVIFDSINKKQDIRKKLEIKLKNEFGFEIPTIIKTTKEIKKISNAIPRTWQNNKVERSDVAYLFPEIDSRKTINELPIKKEFINIIYTKGAIFWNVNRKNYNKSHLNKIINNKLYQKMTVRNVNTTRYLANIKN